MRKYRIEVSRYGNQWGVKREGTNRPLDTFEDQDAAIRKAKELAKQEDAELVIKGGGEQHPGSGPDEVVH